jgi:hypothetical protein
MTVISTYLGQVKAGRFEDALEMSRRAAKPLERLGAHNVRVLRGAASAEAFGVFVLTMEYENNEAWGESYDRIMADDELLSIMAQADSETSPYTSQSIVVGTDIPLGCPTGQGNVVQVTVSKPLPGRFQDTIDLSVKVGALFTRLGAVGSRLLWLGAAGSQAGLMVLTSEYPNMKALGKAADAFMADADGQAILDAAFGVSAPTTILSQEVYQEIPL